MGALFIFTSSSSFQCDLWTVARLLCPWDFPGKNTGVAYHFLLRRIFPDKGSNPHLLLGRGILYHCFTWEVRHNLATEHTHLIELQYRSSPSPQAQQVTRSPSLRSISIHTLSLLRHHYLGFLWFFVHGSHSFWSYIKQWI